MYFQGENTHLLGAMARGRMKEPHQKSGQDRGCAAPWEASCTLPAHPLPTLNMLPSPAVLWVLQDTELSLAAYLPCQALGYLPAAAL